MDLMDQDMVLFKDVVHVRWKIFKLMYICHINNMHTTTFRHLYSPYYIYMLYDLWVSLTRMMCISHANLQIPHP